MEQISIEDLLLLERVKHNRETAHLAEQNIILKIQLKYKLADGDTIQDNGLISRISDVAPKPDPVSISE